MKEYISEIIQESIAVKQRVLESLIPQIELISTKILNSYRSGGKLLLFGNGGSAADAQHIEAELVHQFEIKGRRCIPAISLHTSTSLVTAIGNDWSFEQIFERQIEGLANKNDVLLGFTTSGNSKNVIRGIEQGKRNGAFTIAFTGFDGGKVKDIADIALVIPSYNTARIQESHIMVGHIMCGLVERELFKDQVSAINRML